MQDFITDIGQSYWWISVVVVGILINIVSGIIQRYLDKRTSSISSWWYKRSEKRRKEFFNQVSMGVDNPHNQSILQFNYIKYIINSLFALLFCIVVFVIDASNIHTIAITKFLSITFNLFSTILAMVGYYAFIKAKQIEKLFTEILEIKNGKLFVCSAVYGFNERAYDITNQLREEIKDGKLHIYSDNKLAGDPAPNSPKTLTVIYYYGGTRDTKQAAENTYLSIP